MAQQKSDMILMNGKGRRRSAYDNSRSFSRFSACLNLCRSIRDDGLSFSRRKVACSNVARVEEEKSQQDWLYTSM